jgi:hypothetical protein
MTRASTLLVMMAVAVVGCVGSDDSDLSVRLTEACVATSNMGPELCSCIATEATATLSAPAQRMLLALLEKSPTDLDAVKREASLADATAASTFMLRAPATCAARGVPTQGHTTKDTP